MLGLAWVRLSLTMQQFLKESYVDFKTHLCFLRGWGRYNKVFYDWEIRYDDIILSKIFRNSLLKRLNLKKCVSKRGGCSNNKLEILHLFVYNLFYSKRNLSNVLVSVGPRQANLVLIDYASSEGSGEPAHPRSLARTFAARSYKQWVKRNLQTESQIPGPSEWLGMRS